MLQWLIRRIQSSRRRRGAVAVEFGLMIGPLLLVLVFMTLEIVYAMSARGVAEAGLDTASRFAATGNGGSTMSARVTAYSNKLYALTDSMLDRGNVSFTVTSYPTILGMWNNSPVGGSGNLGASSEFVVYGLTYNHPMLSGGLLCNLFALVNHAVGICDGTLPMVLRIVRQNEPF